MSETKTYVLVVGFKNDDQMIRLLKFLEKHGFLLYGCEDLSEIERAIRDQMFLLEQYEKFRGGGVCE